MKKIKLQELKDSEILEQLEEARKVLRNSRFQYGVARSLENPKIISNTKKKSRNFLLFREKDN
ncbi:ribosomal protein L29 [Leptospira interrogans serovar Copenhageni str. LT2050]|uniref:Large ribosomal subunit protein uL29 n=1 Tax=Leptospira interrogans serovar Copenhageni str. LT2050 TaxID=1001598 RepID=M3HFS7_LEPIT|nr:ribosomal protein L29 [Leptospira interrogans serovar Copenhageni str. LT2050]